jgi:hypothetical protein
MRPRRRLTTAPGRELVKKVNVRCRRLSSRSLTCLRVNFFLATFGMAPSGVDGEASSPEPAGVPIGVLTAEESAEFLPDEPGVRAASLAAIRAAPLETAGVLLLLVSRDSALAAKSSKASSMMPTLPLCVRWPLSTSHRSGQSAETNSTSARSVRMSFHAE